MVWHIQAHTRDVTTIEEVAKQAQDEAETKNSGADDVTANAFKRQYMAACRAFHEDVTMLPKFELWEQFHTKTLQEIYNEGEVPDPDEIESLHKCKNMFFKAGTEMRRNFSKTVRNRVKKLNLYCFDVYKFKTRTSPCIQ